jgi:hypothetical protein
MRRGTRFVGLFVATALGAFANPSLSPTNVASADDGDEPIRALLVIGGCYHDYAKQKDILTTGISSRANVVWTVAYDPDKGTKHLNPIFENADWAKDFDVIVHDECCSDVKDLTIIDRILKPHRDGLPAVILHCGMHSFRSEGWPDKVTPWFEFTGLNTTGHGPQLPIEILIGDKDHPITKDQPDWTTINEELYNNYSGKLEETGKVLARGKQTITSRTARKPSRIASCLDNEYNGRQSVCPTLGHNNPHRCRSHVIRSSPAGCYGALASLTKSI